jgi:hypothetical protein
MSSRTIEIRIAEVSDSVVELAGRPTTAEVQVSFWDRDNELVGSNRFPAGASARTNRARVSGLAEKCDARASYAITEAYDANGRFLDGETISVSEGN